MKPKIKNDKYELWLGDCLEVMRQLPEKSVDMVFSDIPYGMTKNYWDQPIDLLKMWLCFSRVCKPNCAIVLTAKTPYDKILGASNIKFLKYEWIWEKGNATGHLNAKKRPMSAHENIMVFYNDQPTYNPQMTLGHKPMNSYTKRKGDGNNYGKTREVSGGGSTERYPRSVLKFSRDTQKSKLHSTQKPTLLTDYMIETYTNIGDTVLDICMGSGTTGESAIRKERYFIGIDKFEKEYLKGENRLNIINL